MRSKTFFLSAGQIRPDLAPGHGGCVATDEITVRGSRVGYMYREESERDLDSGWSFFAGTETQAQLDDPGNSGVYDVNTIANYDPEIIPCLIAPPFTALERDEDGRFELVEFPTELRSSTRSEGRTVRRSAYDSPLVSGDYSLAGEWRIQLPRAFRCWFKHGSLAMWRPGMTTYIDVSDNDRQEDAERRAARRKAIMSPEAFDIVEEAAPPLTRLAYRLREEPNPSERPGHFAQVPGLYAAVFGASGQVQMAIYFDSEQSLPLAMSLWRGVAQRQ